MEILQCAKDCDPHNRAWKYAGTGLCVSTPFLCSSSRNIMFVPYFLKFIRLKNWINQLNMQTKFWYKYFLLGRLKSSLIRPYITSLNITWSNPFGSRQDSFPPNLFLHEDLIFHFLILCLEHTFSSNAVITGPCRIAQGTLNREVAAYKWVPARIGRLFKDKVLFFHNTNGRLKTRKTGTHL